MSGEDSRLKKSPSVIGKNSKVPTSVLKEKEHACAAQPRLADWTNSSLNSAYHIATSVNREIVADSGFEGSLSDARNERIE